MPGAPLSRLAAAGAGAAACRARRVLLARGAARDASAQATGAGGRHTRPRPEGGPPAPKTAPTKWRGRRARSTRCRTASRLYMTERMQILAAISHDLQTPITRMRLRVDVMDDERARREAAAGPAGNGNAREGRRDVRAHDARRDRSACSVSIPTRCSTASCCDYLDAGKDVSLHGRIGAALVTRPQALRRIVGNLVDNALKFGGAAEIRVARIARRHRDDLRARSWAGHPGRVAGSRCSNRSSGWKGRATVKPAAPGLASRSRGNSRWR